VSRCLRQSPTYAPSVYDPNRQRVLLAPDASDYEVAHENAHLQQQQSETLAWSTHRRFMHTPWLCRFSRLWLETEAAHMALNNMRWLGTWTYAAEQEAKRGLRSYWISLIL